MSGRVFISRNVVFDERIFPFSRQSKIAPTDSCPTLSTHTILPMPISSIILIPPPQPSDGSSTSSSFDRLTPIVQPASSASVPAAAEQVPSADQPR